MLLQKGSKYTNDHVLSTIYFDVIYNCFVQDKSVNWSTRVIPSKLPLKPFLKS